MRFGAIHPKMTDFAPKTKLLSHIYPTNTSSPLSRKCLAENNEGVLYFDHLKRKILPPVPSTLGQYLEGRSRSRRRETNAMFVDPLISRASGPHVHQLVRCRVCYGIFSLSIAAR